MQLSQRLRALAARVRLIISGTPIQNNLGEYWALFDFAVPGLLGPLRAFKLEFEKPILAGQDRGAGPRAREAGAARAAELRRRTAPYMLRREKREVLPGGGGGDDDDAGEEGAEGGGAAGAGAGAAAFGGTQAQQANGAGAPSQQSQPAATPGRPRPARMGRKADLVVWLRLAPLQRHVYEAFLNSDAVREALNSTRSPLAALSVLKKICDHPALLSQRAAGLVVAAGRKWAKAGSGKGGGGGDGGDGDGGAGSASEEVEVEIEEGEVVEAGAAERRGQRQQQQEQRTAAGGGDVDELETSSGGASDGGGSDSDSSADADADDPHAARRAAEKRALEARRREKQAAAAAAAAGIGYSDEWCDWAASGSEVEARLLADLEQRGAEASCKTAFVAALLDELVAKGHRVLVFSQSRVMLDILQAAVEARRLQFCRIDGAVATAEARQAEVERFQRPGSTVPVFLLTSQVGGLGLTLTAADRVVIVDPSWNPAQASACFVLGALIVLGCVFWSRVEERRQWQCTNT